MAEYTVQTRDSVCPEAPTIPGEGNAQRTIPDRADTLDYNIQRGELIGRYVVLERIGFGGMGVVFKALDPELERRVAIKVLRPELTAGADNTQGRARLVRESQAIAQLSHPNVVAVHDIGLLPDGRCFVAMEYLEGKSLREWLADKQRSLSEILSVFIPAGRGLAAAHSKGLIHRDFKPDNVMVTDAGEVRVVDFGLARCQDAPANEFQEVIATGDYDLLAPTLDTPLTRAGEVMGTPGYMAPEQYRGESGTPQTDQYAFCTALYEAFAGKRPYRRAMGLPNEDEETKPIAPLPAEARVPKWLEQLILRGLQRDASARYDSMDALLVELGRDRLQRWKSAAVGGVGILLTAGLLIMAMLGSEAERRCQNAGALFEQVWNDEARAAVQQSFAVHSGPLAAETLPRVLRAIDAYGEQWRGRCTSACEATQVHGTQSAEALDLSMTCLHRRLSELDALVEVLSGPLAKDQIPHLVTAVYSLPAIDTCADVDALGDAPRLPNEPSLRAAITEQRHTGDRISALLDTGAYAEGLDASTALLPTVESLSYPPLRGEALLVHARALQHAGKTAEAEKALWEALQLAADSKNRSLGVQCMSRLLWSIGYYQARHAEARSLFETGVAMAKLYDDSPSTLATFHNGMGGMLYARGEYEEAELHFREGLALLRSMPAPAPDRLATMMDNLGSLLSARGQPESALPLHRQAMALVQETWGPSHPNAHRFTQNLATAYAGLGQYAEARRYLERAIDGMEQTQGKDYYRLDIPLHNLGEIYSKQGLCAEAVPVLNRALEVARKHRPANHPFLVYPLLQLGHCYNELGQSKQALPLLRVAIAPMDQRAGDPAMGAELYLELAIALWNSGAPHSEAVAAAEVGRAQLARAEQDPEEVGPRLDAWLAAHSR